MLRLWMLIDALILKRGKADGMDARLELMRGAVWRDDARARRVCAALRARRRRCRSLLVSARSVRFSASRARMRHLSWCRCSSVTCVMVAPPRSGRPLSAPAPSASRLLAATRTLHHRTNERRDHSMKTNEKMRIKRGTVERQRTSGATNEYRSDSIDNQTETAEHRARDKRASRITHAAALHSMAIASDEEAVHNDAAMHTYV
jgi:hypothetical protein